MSKIIIRDAEKNLLPGLCLPPGTISNKNLAIVKGSRWKLFCKWTMPKEDASRDADRQVKSTSRVLVMSIPVDASKAFFSWLEVQAQTWVASRPRPKFAHHQRGTHHLTWKVMWSWSQKEFSIQFDPHRNLAKKLSKVRLQVELLF